MRFAIVATTVATIVAAGAVIPGSSFYQVRLCRLICLPQVDVVVSMNMFILENIASALSHIGCHGYIYVIRTLFFSYAAK